MDTLHTLNGKPIGNPTVTAATPVPTLPNPTVTTAIPRLHKPDSGDVGVIGEVGELGSNAK